MPSTRTVGYISLVDTVFPELMACPVSLANVSQANKWIKAMEGKDLTVVDLNTKDFLRQMGNCIQYGLPCLLQVT